MSAPGPDAPVKARMHRLTVPDDCAGCGDWAVVLISAGGRVAPYCSVCAAAMVASRPLWFADRDGDR